MGSQCEFTRGQCSWCCRGTDVVGVCQRPNNAKHKIVTHDTEVYDVAFCNVPYMFGSVGDKSLRLFDLRFGMSFLFCWHLCLTCSCVGRQLSSSTIVFESRDSSPLVRVAFNKRDDRYLATFANGSSTISVIDRRHTSYPVVELNHHTAGVNSISWSPHSRYELCSAAEDRTVRMYDICACVTAGTELGQGLVPNGWNSNTLLKSQEPINQVSWSPTDPACIGLVDESALHVVQV